MTIELQWCEVEEGYRGFQLAPPDGREYDLFFREKAKRIAGFTYIKATEWQPVPIAKTLEL